MLRRPNAETGIVGRRVSIEVEAGDARPGVFDNLLGTITSVKEIGANQFVLIVTIRPSVRLTSGIIVEDILVTSPEDILAKLSASESSQLSLSLPVVMWRMESREVVDRIRSAHKLPPATAYLGRAELLLLPA
jgi:hypothetical protein